MAPLIETALGAGLIGVAALALLERLIPVIPSYAMLVILGTAYVRSAYDLATVTLVTTFGTSIGAACWYGLGRRLGARRAERMIAKFGRYLFLDSDRYRRLSARYERNYALATFVGQVIPVVRVYLSLPAGVLALPPRGFMLAVFLGSAVWNIAFLFIGYGLNIFGWNSLFATLVAVSTVIALEGAVYFWMRGSRSEAASRTERGRSNR